VFLAGVEAGLVPLAIFGAVMSVISAFYYLKLVKIMWFDPEAPALDRTQPWAGLAAGFAAVLVLAGIAALGYVEAAAKAAATAF
jgi:NADH-quinone oxidoreductase subunit N